MNGKIDGLPLQPQNTRTANASRAANKQAQAQSQPNQAAPNDTVNLTPSAQNLQRLEQSLATTPAVDHNRVDSIRQALANGQYEINSQRIADQLLQSDQALGKAQS